MLGLEEDGTMSVLNVRCPLSDASRLYVQQPFQGVEADEEPPFKLSPLPDFVQKGNCHSGIKLWCAYVTWLVLFQILPCICWTSDTSRNRLRSCSRFLIQCWWTRAIAKRLVTSDRTLIVARITTSQSFKPSVLWLAVVMKAEAFALMSALLQLVSSDSQRMWLFSRLLNGVIFSRWRRGYRFWNCSMVSTRLLEESKNLQAGACR